jgi:alpha-tubulin suppressor-like RCC1 family protein
MGEGADAGRADGRLYLGGNLFGLSADDKGKISARAAHQQGSSDGDGEEDDGDNATAADKKETRSLAAALLDAPPLVSGLLLAGDWVVRQVSCGYRHTALITTTGLLLTCGHGETGRLGHGDERSRYFPTVVRAFLGGQGASGNHGSSSSSDGSGRPRLKPLQGAASKAEGVVFVACGREHTVAVDEDGGVWSWGWGEAGRLGVGEVGKVLSPTRVTQYLGVRPEKATKHGLARAPPPIQSIGVACGREHTLVWTTTGQVFACGPGYGGRLGLGSSAKDVLFPTLVGTGVDLEHELVIGAACGDMHSAVATASGCVYTWGFGATGALGHGGSLVNQPLPKRVDSFLTAFDDFVAVASVACGAYHTLALSTRGEVFAFGDGESGALGLEDRGDAATHRATLPTLVPALHALAFGGGTASDDSDSSDDSHAGGDGDDEDVFKYGDKPAADSSQETSMDQSDEHGGANSGAPVAAREGLRRQGSGARDGSGWGAVAAIAAGHLTSAAVDRRGRLFVWGCAYAEDGVQPSVAELTPRRCRVAASSPSSSSQGAVAFRSVGMGGYHTVVATQVRDRWGRPFDSNFSGLPRGLQLPTAKHAERSKAAGNLDAELAALAAERAEQAADAAEAKDKTARETSGSRGGAAASAEASQKAALADPRVGRLLVAPGCGAGPAEGPAGALGHPGRTHQALFVAPAIDKAHLKKGKYA